MEEFDERLLSARTISAEDDTERSLRPHRLTEYVGQENVKELLKVYIEAAKQRGDALDHVLLYGPPGLGKTTLANIIAAEMGVSIRITSGRARKDRGYSRASDQLAGGGYSVHRRNTPTVPHGRGSPLSRHGGL